MFGVCFLMRGTIKSELAIKQMVKMHAAHPELFDPEFLSQPHINAEYIFERLRNFIRFRLFELSRLWLDGFRRMQEDWAGDPLNIFDGVEDSAELYRRMVNIESIPKSKRVPDKLRGFVGCREKIANMFAYFLLEAWLIKPIKTSSPFDFHNGRTFIVTEAIILEGDGPFRFEDVTGIGSAAVEEYGIRNNVSMEVMSNAFWLPSTYLCSRAPGNKTVGRDRTKNVRKGERHRLDYKPRKREKQDLKMYQPDWSSVTDVLQYELTCGRCLLAKAGLCKLNVGAGFFYESGQYVASPRSEPIPHLFAKEGLGHHHSGKKRPPEREADPVKEPLPVLTGLDVSLVQRKPKVETLDPQ
jgi:hypothetical protein